MATESTEWVLDHYLVHELHQQIERSARVRLPDSNDEWIELYLDVFFDDPERLRRLGGGLTDNDGNPVKYDAPDVWHKPFLGGHTSAHPDFLFKTKNVKQVVFSGSVYSSVGTRFWWEIYQRGEEDPVEINPLRIPVPDSMIEEIREWADDRGGRVPRVKGAVFEERFSDVMGGPVSDVRHNDVHVIFDEIHTADEVEDIFRESLQFVERAARMG